MTSKLHTKIFHGQLYKQAPLEVQEIVETAPQSSFLAWGLPPRDPTPSNSNTGFPITSENGIGLKIPSYWRKWDPPGDCIPMNIDHGFPLKGCQRLAQGKPPRFHKTSNGAHLKKTGRATTLKTAGGEQAPFCQCLSQKSGKTKMIQECMVRHAGAATMMGHSWGALRRYIQ